MLGIVFGMMIGAGLRTISPHSAENRIEKVIEQCEKDLPRNQHCTITGIVEKPNE
jgi:hypothetical protein